MESATAQQSQAAPPPRLRERYEQEVLPDLLRKFRYSTPMQAPRLQKIVLNMGVGEARQNAKLLEAPNNAGWLIVKLDTIVPGDARKTPEAVAGARGSIARIVGREYAEQFARAVRDAVGVKTDAAALARVRADLTGNGN